MASTVYEIEQIELQDGTVVELRPLPIKRLRRFMKVIDEMTKKTNESLRAALEAASKDEDEENSAEGETPDTEEFSDDDNLEFLISAVQICLEKTAPELSADRDRLEDALDVPTIWKILEVCGGVSQNPNLLPGATVSPGTT